MAVTYDVVRFVCWMSVPALITNPDPWLSSERP